MEPVSGEFAVSIDVSDQPAPETETRQLTGTVLAGRYELQEVVGGGGMGTVYRANDMRAAREVAVKVLDPRFDPAKDPASRERFLREARLSTRLSHANIVEVLESGESEGVHFIAMELLHGRTLAQLLEAEGALPWPRALNFMRQMSAGLAFAHELGLVHRDLKPANCFVLSEGEDEWLKLLDFGLAKSVVADAPGDDDVTRTSVVMGSPTYMAPEQARGEASVQSDIYALGVMLFRMLAGQAPFSGRTAVEVIVNHIQSRVPWLEELSLTAPVPLAVELVMRRCLEKDPRARFHSVQTLLAAIDEAEVEARHQPTRRVVTGAPHAVEAATESPGATPPTPPRPTDTALFQAVREPVRSSASWPMGLAAVLVVAGAGALWWHARGARPVEPPKAPEPAPPTAQTAKAEPKGPVLFRINSIPTGATVKVGSKVVGQTPTAFPMEPDESGEATAELTLELKGYQTITFIATSPGPRFDLVQRLQKGAGRVALPPLTGTAAPSPEEPAQKPAASASTDEEPELFVPMPLPAPTPPRLARTAEVTAPAGPAPLEALTVRPRLISAAPPRYPQSARVAKVEGTAVARCVVTKSGHLEQCRLVKGLPLMDEAILESLQTRVYEPGRIGQQPVDTVLNIAVKVSR